MFAPCNGVWSLIRKARQSGLDVPLKAVVHDFTAGRAGEHARSFLGDW